MNTDGFLVLAFPPSIGDISVTDIVKNVDQTDLHLSFQPFTHEQIEDVSLTSEDLMDYYEWIIMDEAGEDGAIYPWQKIDGGDLTIVNEEVM